MEKPNAHLAHGSINRKGKGRELAVETDTTEKNLLDAAGTPTKKLPTDTTVVSRLASSAVALGNSLLSNPDTETRLLGPEKTGGASDTTTRSTIGEASRHKAKTGSSTDLGSSFRASQTYDYVQREEAAFSRFLDGIDKSGPSSIDSSAQLIGGLEDNTPLSAPQMTQTFHDSRFANNDGQEVVKLLDTAYDDVLQADPEPSLSQEDEASLRQALFGSDVISGESSQDISDWANLLNFVPEYISNGASSWGHNELLQHLGTSDVQEASNLWAEQWGNVLSRYTDEVWGDLGSLVEEAKKEARHIQESGREATPSEATAILRLRQILAHVRGD
ncbi:hypothetical protein BKA67DRAFT_541452 [Truncatella angustata]|uniref:Uncharacterized protein n=1 Tax=Truncatella angustata TaxID=152316 RepID=A0A9P8U9N0_9PEZI|nr:uncharacterized protein BKA67DRAFT_541452 [Truncatella angustata]KAH6646489.1 hypothetical protein BKA67DRAFT_541452 [Truncatella angustata]